MPWGIVLVTLALLALGWLAIARGEELAGGTGWFLRRQMVWSALGMAAMLLVSLPSYRVLGRLSYAAFAAANAMLVFVYLFPAINGTHRWIRWGSLSLQPSEFAKIGFVLAVARYLSQRTDQQQPAGLAVPLALATVPMVLIVREPDLGTALVFVPVLGAMLYASGARVGQLARAACCGVLLLPFLWTQMSIEQKSRVVALFDQPVPPERARGEGYQLYQAKQMLALGGTWGSRVSGQPTDDPAVYHLPEARTDFVFTLLGERLGWLGTGGALALFGMLIWQGLRIAEATRDPFGRLLAVGLVSLFAVESLINAGMTVGLLPITGLPLPLISYGGSGLLAHALAIGLLLNIGMRPGYHVGREPYRFAA